MFKLGAATSCIVVLVALLQTLVGFQIFRMNDTQASIMDTSMPLLDETQLLARLTTRLVSQTALLGSDLAAGELRELRESYNRNEAEAEGVLQSILTRLPANDMTVGLQDSRDRFSDVNKLLFDNQFMQRAQEQSIAEARATLLAGLSKQEDILDQSLISTTSRMLNPNGISEERENGTDKMMFRSFAGEIEVLNSLRSSVIEIMSMLGNLGSDQNIDEFAKGAGFELRGLAQSLTLLRASDAPRRELAQLISATNKGLSNPGGLIDQLSKNLATRQEFERLRREQAAAVTAIDFRTAQIVSKTSELFHHEIETATNISQRILWIGVATTMLVLGSIYFINQRVIRRQISERFVTLTEDVLAIADGNYGHKIRVGGADEIGDIAKALNGFKGQAAELQRSNAELERFAYVAAHDLKSPLDAIQDLARWTLEDERDSLTPVCIQNLELLIKRSERLAQLQSDLLTYAKVADINTAPQSLELDAEIQKLSDLLDPDGNFNIRLSHDPGPITTFGVPLRQILMNLITNAIKHHDHPTGNVVVHYERVDQVHRITVEDDGPGIEIRFQKKIFELFKRLKSRDEVEGSGLGLALVHKLVERLDGRIWVESYAPKTRGSKFVFELANLTKRRRREDTAA